MADTVLCSCGSGLRTSRCCALDLGDLPAAAALALLDDKAGEATRLYNEKKRIEAESLVLKLLDLAPAHRVALRVLFEIRRHGNNGKAAEALARRLSSLPTENAATATAAHLQLAQLLMQQGRHQEAMAPARLAIIRSPRDATAQHVLGVVFTETGRLAEGAQHYRNALAIMEREDGLVLANLAWNLKLQGDLEAAAAAYERALAIRPDNARAVGGAAQVQLARGQTGAAIALLDDGLARWPADRALRLLRALVDLHTGDAAAVLTRLAGLEETLLPAELSARGQALFALGQIAPALASHTRAKTLQTQRPGQAYQADVFLKKAERYRRTFTAGQMAALPRAGPAAGPQPVFILGFPGSGTALLEQLLSALPGFAPADQYIPIDGLIAEQGEAYPENLPDMLIGDSQAMPQRLHARYLELVAGQGLQTADYITHRAAGDVWHLGLIKLLFPEVLILHVIRHPLDVMLSNFSQDHRLEGNCATSLLSLARHYDLTMSLLRHYRGQMSLRYLPVRYEDIVTDTVQVVHKIIDFAGFPGLVPDPAALRANAVRPARPGPVHRIAQQEIHHRSLFKYRIAEAAVPDFFSEVRPLLAPWISELGYGP